MINYENDPTEPTAAWAVGGEYVTSRHGRRDKDNSFIPCGDAPGNIAPRVNDNARKVVDAIHRTIGIPRYVLALLSSRVESLPIDLVPQGVTLFVIRAMTKPPSGAQSGDTHDSVIPGFRHSPE